jgi:hypothetical protein
MTLNRSSGSPAVQIEHYCFSCYATWRFYWVTDFIVRGQKWERYSCSNCGGYRDFATAALDTTEQNSV